MSAPDTKNGGGAGECASRRFSPEARKRIEWLTSRYPVKEAALLPILRLAEEEFGVVDEAAVDCVAQEVGVPPAHVHGVLTFYTQYRRPGDGKYLIQVCGTLPCDLRGCGEVARHLQERLGIRVGQTTPDGKFTIKKVECLGACDAAPVVEINGDYYEKMTPEKIDVILESLP